jgi:hypothetical protein
LAFLLGYSLPFLYSSSLCLFRYSVFIAHLLKAKGFQEHNIFEGRDFKGWVGLLVHILKVKGFQEHNIFEGKAFKEKGLQVTGRGLAKACSSKVGSLDKEPKEDKRKEERKARKSCFGQDRC